MIRQWTDDQAEQGSQQRRKSWHLADERYGRLKVVGYLWEKWSKCQ